MKPTVKPKPSGQVLILVRRGEVSAFSIKPMPRAPRSASAPLVRLDVHLRDETKTALHARLSTDETKALCAALQEVLAPAQEAA